MPITTEPEMPLPPEMEMRLRIERLEAENAAIKEAVREMLGGVRPANGTPNPFHLPNVKRAQAMWDALFGPEKELGDAARMGE